MSIIINTNFAGPDARASLRATRQSRRDFFALDLVRLGEDRGDSRSPQAGSTRPKGNTASVSGIFATNSNEAERFNDPERALKAREEIEFLTPELARGDGSRRPVSQSRVSRRAGPSEPNDGDPRNAKEDRREQPGPRTPPHRDHQDWQGLLEHARAGASDFMEPLRQADQYSSRCSRTTSLSIVW